MNWEGIYAIWLRDLKAMFRERSRLYGAIMRPILWLFIMGNGLRPAMQGVSGVEYTQFIFPGVVGMTLIFSSLQSATSIIWDREFGFLREVMVAPMSRGAVVVGKVLGGSTQATVQGLITMLFAPLVGVYPTPVQVLRIVLLMLLISSSLTSLGILIASRMTSFEGFGAISNFVVMPMYFLSGSIYPLTNLPLWLKALTTINPLSYGVDAMRGQIIHIYHFSLLTDVLAIAGFGAVMLTLAIPMFSRS
ncbi:MAG: ABC transporter permease [Desulfitobacteriaceae bacterium]|nr:ABC transporter permease [Desulfitobacteriaceae bacterium]MDI6878909.1 ABC transporter permease [Desulfitobacteriaceae bacterium]MDI6913340.1 ABC transporter permease [Desulfitobacteriaceae bacterium]